MKKNTLIFLFLIFSINTVYALDGWNKDEQNNSLVYTPSNLKKGKVFRITVLSSKGINTNELKKWFLSSAKKQQALLGNSLKPWVIKPEKNNSWSISNKYLTATGKKMAVGYQGGRLKDGRAYISQMVSSSDLGILVKYGMQFNKVVENAKTYLSKNSSFKSNQKQTRSNNASKTTSPTTTKAEENTKLSNTTNSQLTPANPPKGFKDLRGVMVFRIQTGGLFALTSEVIATFKNGTYTSDLGRVFAKGKSVSKAAKPRRWGKWRIKRGKLEMKKNGDKKFKKARSNWITRPASLDLKLNGCYGKLTSASTSPYGVRNNIGVASSWCFKRNGLFSHSRTGFANLSGNGVRGSTSSKSKAGGRYRIDGYTARFIYDDGKEIVTAFCFLNEKKSHIAINGKRYMGRN